MLPFVLNPNAALNKEGTGYRSNSDPQYFTYKNTSKHMWSGKAQLNFCPTSIQKHFNEDIGNKLIYSSNDSKSSVEFNYLLNDIPGVQIREYIPDTALDQLISFFTSMMKSVMSLFGSDGISLDSSLSKDEKKGLNENEIKAAEEAKQNSLFDKLKNVCIEIMKYISANTEDPNIIKKMCGTTSSSYGYKGLEAPKILDFPYMLYYQLQSCTTTNIYEVPALKTDNIMYSSDGEKGWNTADSGFRLINKTLSSLPVVGSFLSKLFGNIGISWMPWWDAISGNTTPEPQVKIDFDLYNDNIKSTIANFIFVNTLIASNKWIQYGLFQHSSNIYDVKLEGYNRLFACTGKFEVQKRGVLRMPPSCLFESGEKETSLFKYLNNNISNKENFLQKLKTQKSIMIPDIYHVTMTFDSLLPANFNNYLYTLVANQDPIEKYYYKTYDESKAATALTDVVDGLITHVKNTWNKK